MSSSSSMRTESSGQGGRRSDTESALFLKVEKSMDEGNSCILASSSCSGSAKLSDLLRPRPALKLDGLVIVKTDCCRDFGDLNNSVSLILSCGYVT